MIDSVKGLLLDLEIIHHLLYPCQYLVAIDSLNVKEQFLWNDGNLTVGLR
jgi:hypothetical protein